MKTENAARTARWRAANPERARAWSRSPAGKLAKRARRKTPAGKLARQRQKRAYRIAHPDKVRASTRRATQRWRSAHPEQAKAGALRQRRTPAGRLRHKAQKHTRRARKSGAAAERVTAAHLKLLFAAQDGRCRYCRAPLGEDKHLEHRVPLARGGPHAPSNLCWSCPGCNNRKGVQTEAEFLKATA